MGDKTPQAVCSIYCSVGKQRREKGLWWWKWTRMGRGVFTLSTESKEGGSFERREGTHTINKDQGGGGGYGGSG